MSATHRVIAVESYPEKPKAEAGVASAGIATRRSVRETQQPSLRVVPLLRPMQPRRFARVPTYAVGIHPEQREYPRAALKLPLRLRSVNHVPEQYPITLVTRDISSTGVYFLCPKPLDLQTRIELEIVLVSRPMGRGNVVLATKARVLRVETVATPGWHGIACAFDDVQFDRDDSVPSRFLYF
jgi:hypothetical protein